MPNDDNMIPMDPFPLEDGDNTQISGDKEHYETHRKRKIAVASSLLFFKKLQIRRRRYKSRDYYREKRNTEV